MSEYNSNFEEQCIMLADMFLSMEDPTVRKLAREVNLSKTSVHKYLSVNLKKFDVERAQKVNAVFEKNKKERSRRGGLALAAVMKARLKK